LNGAYRNRVNSMLPRIDDPAGNPVPFEMENASETANRCFVSPLLFRTAGVCGAFDNSDR